MQPLERRAVSTRSTIGNGHTIAGQIAYNSRSEDLGFYEYIMPGCFAESLRTVEVMCYWSHDSAQILGRQSNGSLRIEDTPNALRWVCDLPETQLGADTAALIRDGYVKANSFGFYVPNEAGAEDWTQDAAGNIIRRVYKAVLLECSPVGVPAYEANTTTLVRSMPQWVRERINSKRDGNGSQDPEDGTNRIEFCLCDEPDTDDSEEIQRCKQCGLEIDDDSDDITAAQESGDRAAQRLLNVLRRY